MNVAGEEAWEVFAAKARSSRDFVPSEGIRSPLVTRDEHVSGYAARLEGIDEDTALERFSVDDYGILFFLFGLPSLVVAKVTSSLWPLLLAPVLGGVALVVFHVTGRYQLRRSKLDRQQRPGRLIYSRSDLAGPVDAETSGTQVLSLFAKMTSRIDFRLRSSLLANLGEALPLADTDAFMTDVLWEVAADVHLLGLISKSSDPDAREVSKIRSRILEAYDSLGVVDEQVGSLYAEQEVLRSVLADEEQRLEADRLVVEALSERSAHYPDPSAVVRGTRVLKEAVSEVRAKESYLR